MKERVFPPYIVAKSLNKDVLGQLLWQLCDLSFTVTPSGYLLLFKTILLMHWLPYIQTLITSYGLPIVHRYLQYMSPTPSWSLTSLLFFLIQQITYFAGCLFSITFTLHGRQGWSIVQYFTVSHSKVFASINDTRWMNSWRRRSGKARLCRNNGPGNIFVNKHQWAECLR